MTPRALAAASLLLAACQAGPTPRPVSNSPRPEPVEGPTLVGSRWVGIAEGDVDARQLPRLEFVSADRVSGYTGCNMLSGAWRVQDGEVKLGPLATTKRACIGPGAEVERRVLAALAGRVVRAGDRLVFTAPDGGRYEFMPAQAS
ncbi:MAG TPA: META domain-containing protein [Usitatibacter sp.]|nr:META domain-containing protein [Usitatibacter sp.]